jgi:hypothetical protein
MYIKIGLAIYCLSLGPFLVGLYLAEAKTGFFTAGLVVLLTGITMISIGVIKRDRLLH